MSYRYEKVNKLIKNMAVSSQPYVRKPCVYLVIKSKGRRQSARG